MIYFVHRKHGVPLLGMAFASHGMSASMSFVPGGQWRSIGGDLEDARQEGYRLAYGEECPLWSKATEDEIKIIRLEIGEDVCAELDETFEDVSLVHFVSEHRFPVLSGVSGS